MNIFNSLGSNYNLATSLHILFRFGGKLQVSALKRHLAERYGGDVTLLYKGRDALEYILKGLDLPSESYVAINGYTCYVVNKAVLNAGLHTTYLDIDENSLHFGAETLRDALAKNKNIKVVVVQNTLGFPCDIEGIAEVCREHDVILIEDLAHSIGARYKNGREAGTVGDFTFLSFGQDKVIDVVSGGAVVQRNKDIMFRHGSLTNVSFTSQLRDRLYPITAWIIRNTYSFAVGKVIHIIAKRIGIMSSPVLVNEEANRALPNSYAGVILKQFKRIDSVMDHRQKIAAIYKKVIPAENTYSVEMALVNNSANLRFPIKVSDRESLISYMQKQGVYISDIWYDAPISPKKYLNMVPYKDECKRAERAGEEMVNLPTHSNVLEADAERIAKYVNTWLQLQQK